MSDFPFSPADRLELALVAELKTLLMPIHAGEHFTVEPSDELCYSLELYLPRILATQYPEWDTESLDGLFVAQGVKTGIACAELVGICVIISDQTVAPFQVEVVLASSDAALLQSIRIRIGEPGGGRLGISGPRVHSKAANKLLANVLPRVDTIPWAYDLEVHRSRK